MDRPVKAFRFDGGLLLLIVLTCLLGIVAYQAPASGRVAIGWLGDRLFLDAHEGLGQRDGFYADDLTPDSPTMRSRWMRQEGEFRIASLGAGSPLELTILAQGWPADLLDRPASQPTVSVQANGVEIGSFVPSTTWDEYRFQLPEELRQAADLTLRLRASDTFTSTERGIDNRLKGVRLAELRIEPLSNPQSIQFLPPAWPMIAQMVLVAILIYALLMRLFGQQPRAIVSALIVVGLIGAALGIARLWTVALLGAQLFQSDNALVAVLGTPLVLLFGLLLLLTWRAELVSVLRALLTRYSQGRGLGYALVTAALAWLCYVLARWSQSARLPSRTLFFELFPDSLLYGLFGMGLLALLIVKGREGLPRIAESIVGFFDHRRAAPTLVALFGLIWIGYQASVVLKLPYVGHADYADNAVVARNLLAGRGWVVDYVTQFYQIYPSLTRPQETWPLLQPVWIAISFAVFGISDWAAKIPNLVCNLLLLVLIYRIGARIWDRRVGLTAAILLLTNMFFFRLTIYATSDLAFVVLALAAIYSLYLYRSQIVTDAPSDWKSIAKPGSPLFFLVCSGVLNGLMILQKPSSAIFTAGMGLWLLADARFALGLRDLPLLPRSRAGWRSFWQRFSPTIMHGLVWGLLVLAVMSPYVVRNLSLWGKPLHSTESYDAWVLSYRGDTPEAWDDIYRLYDPSLGGAGLPDRSWILRWGFDQTFDKFERQVVAVRDYLMPPWRAAPSWLAPLFGREDKQLLFGLGAWLSLAGLIAALRFRRRLLALLLFAYLPYTVFLATYWHTNEERYFVALMPWLALLIAWMIWAAYRRLVQIGDGRWAPLGVLLACAMVVGVVQPSWSDISNKIENEPKLWQADLLAYDWIRANTPEGAAMMTRTPWQLNWHTERPALMIPNTPDREQMLELARHYKIEYLVLETIHRPKGDARRSIENLVSARTAQAGEVIDGFELVYASPTEDNRVLIYRFPQP